MFIGPHPGRTRTRERFSPTKNDRPFMLDEKWITHVCCLLLAMPATAQTDIPIGHWRMHLSYNDIRQIEISPDQVFAASNSGILIFNRAEQSLTSYSKLNGLSRTGITSLKYDDTNNQLLVGYESQQPTANQEIA